MIPRWKLRREIQRLGQQLRAIPEALWEPVARYRHDAALARGFATLDGGQGLAPKLALVLCWQPNGIMPSLLDTLDHLVGHGYAPFLVSNAPLSAADRARLAPRIWRAVERPNFGYDFGGYRDGLWLLRHWGIQPERLVILNDSVWFPLWPDDLTLEKAESAPFDVTGTILRRKDSTTFLESYFFSMEGQVLDHPGFRVFWDGLRLTSNKYKVIRRGERGFGTALAAAGISFGPLFPDQAFREVLSHSDEPGLRQALRYAAVLEDKLSQDVAALAGATAGHGWSEKAQGLIDRVLVKAQAYSSFPVVAGRIGYPVLKKSAEPVSTLWRANFLRAVEDGILPHPLASVVREARAATPGS